MDNAPVTFYDCSFSYGQSREIDLPKRVTLETIQAVQAELAKLPQIETTAKHYFAAGMYGRECSIPGGSIVIGKQHRHEHLVMLTKGKTKISVDGEMTVIEAPFMWVSKPGEKRILYTYTDCIFVTTHATSETDLDALEAELIVPEPLPEIGADDFHSNALQGVFA